MLSGPLAWICFFISSLSAGALAQTAPPAPTQPSPAGEALAPQAPVATTPEPAPPPARSEGKTLPTITVSGQHNRRSRWPCAAAEPAPAATPTPPSPYETGAPNVAGGTPVVPQMASQMTISGETSTLVR